MEQIRPLILKFVYIAAISLIFLTYLLVPSVPVLTTLILAGAVALALYYGGDRFLLVNFGALTAAIANFLLAALIFTLARAFIKQPLSSGAIFSAAAVIGVAEWFYYRFAREAPVLKGKLSLEESGENSERQEGAEGPAENGQGPSDNE